MNTHIISKTEPLVYNGVAISATTEMLSLTDMWTAGGRDEAKRPANWARKEGASFIEAVSLSLDMPVGHIYKTRKGGRGIGGETFAHWQIGLAYAKYLSPQFHMWCNQVVRERMEGRAVAMATSLTERDREIIGNMIKRCTGVVIKEQLSEMMSQFLPSAVAGYIADHHLSIADGVTAGEACDLAKVATHYPRGLSGRVSRRLALYCARNGEKPRVTRLGRVRAQLFPTHLVREWLDVEGRSLIKKWIDERNGQKTLRLVPKEDA